MSHLNGTLPAQTAAGADSTTSIGAVEVTDDNGVAVSRAVLVPPAGFVTVTGAVTNNATISFRQLRAGSLVGTVASVTLAVGTNLVAETPLVVPLSGSPVLQQDDVIDVLMHQNASGIAIGVGILAEVEIN